MTRLRGNREPPNVSGSSVVVVDDGLATGFTMLAEVAALRRIGVAHICVCVPTAHLDAIAQLESEVDATYCANVRDGRQFAVAEAYERWYDVSDEELGHLLCAGNEGGGATCHVPPISHVAPGRPSSGTGRRGP
jgi:putative phosphoribosyl transferase